MLHYTLLAIFACIAFVSAQHFTITYPDPAHYWIANVTNSLEWITAGGTGHPSLFSVYIYSQTNSVIQENTGRAQLGIANNIHAIDGIGSANTLPSYVSGDGFQLIFTDIFNASNIFATSGVFQVLPQGTQVSPTLQPVPGDNSQYAATTTVASEDGIVVKTQAGVSSTTSSNSNFIPNTATGSNSARASSATVSSASPLASGTTNTTTSDASSSRTDDKSSSEKLQISAIMAAFALLLTMAY